MMSSTTHNNNNNNNNNNSASTGFEILTSQPKFSLPPLPDEPPNKEIGISSLAVANEPATLSPLQHPDKPLDRPKSCANCDHKGTNVLLCPASSLWFCKDQCRGQYRQAQPDLFAQHVKRRTTEATNAKLRRSTRKPKPLEIIDSPPPVPPSKKQARRDPAPNSEDEDERPRKAAKTSSARDSNKRQQRNDRAQRRETPNNSDEQPAQICLVDALSDGAFRVTQQQKRTLSRDRANWVANMAEANDEAASDQCLRKLKAGRDALLSTYQVQIDKLNEYMHHVEQASNLWSAMHLGYDDRYDVTQAWLVDDRARIDKLMTAYDTIDEHYGDAALLSKGRSLGNNSVVVMQQPIGKRNDDDDAIIQEEEDQSSWLVLPDEVTATNSGSSSSLSASIVLPDTTVAANDPEPFITDLALQLPGIEAEAMDVMTQWSPTTLVPLLQEPQHDIFLPCSPIRAPCPTTSDEEEARTLSFGEALLLPPESVLTDNNTSTVVVPALPSALSSHSDDDDEEEEEIVIVCKKKKSNSLVDALVKPSSPKKAVPPSSSSISVSKKLGQVAHGLQLESSGSYLVWSTTKRLSPSILRASNFKFSCKSPDGTMSFYVQMDEPVGVKSVNPWASFVWNTWAVKLRTRGDVMITATNGDPLLDGVVAQVKAIGNVASKSNPDPSTTTAGTDEPSASMTDCEPDGESETSTQQRPQRRKRLATGAKG